MAKTTIYGKPRGPSKTIDNRDRDWKRSRDPVYNPCSDILQLCHMRVSRLQVLIVCLLFYSFDNWMAMNLL